MTKRILIIDDDEGILEALSLMLHHAGYYVEIGTTAKNLQQLDLKHPPDLILLDVFLSGADGRILCKQLKFGRLTKHIPVILLSAAQDVKKSIHESRADDFLAKPFEMTDLLTMIEKYV